MIRFDLLKNRNYIFHFYQDLFRTSGVHIKKTKPTEFGNKFISIKILNMIYLNGNLI